MIPPKQIPLSSETSISEKDYSTSDTTFSPYNVFMDDKFYLLAARHSD
jgi:hypothetical protein